MHAIMTIHRRLATGAILAVFVGACAGTGGQPTSSLQAATPDATAEPTPSLAPAATAGPTTSPAPTLTQTFTSPLHGISLSYPEGWAARAATEAWTEPTFPLNVDLPHADFLYDPDLPAGLFVTMASQPIGDASSGDWVAAQMSSGEGCQMTRPITVGGAAGLIGANGCTVAVVTTDDRGYWIQLYTSGDISGYDAAWFEEVLATVSLQS